MRCCNSKCYARSSGFSSVRLIVGLTVIAIGVLLTLDQFDVLHADDYLTLWPIALIAVGATKLFSRRLPDLLFAFLFIGVGVWILAYNLGWVHEVPWEYFWPIILVIIGFNLVFGGLRRRRIDADPDSYVTAFAMLGGADRKSTTDNFEGADLTAIMGGTELDLRKAKIAPGTVPVIHVFVMWGGIEVRFPQDWKIDFGVLPILGGYEDTTEQETGDDRPTVVVKGTVIMGGLDLKN